MIKMERLYLVPILILISLCYMVYMVVLFTAKVLSQIIIVRRLKKVFIFWFSLGNYKIQGLNIILLGGPLCITHSGFWRYNHGEL